MKPVSVRFRCFGPYMAEQMIDFRELEQNGLFLICGETGAGKTTILDAICYALYGCSSGGLRGDLDVMRCKLAGKEDETEVEFIFDCGGERYKFIRSLKYKTKNIHDSHNCLIFKDGVYVPLLENPKKKSVSHMAEELIGLTYDQFRQVIILPQGQFEKLLVSDSAEKEKILVSLFQADRWNRIAKELSRRVRLQDEKLKQEMLFIRGKLREYGCETLEALDGLCKQEEENLSQLRRQAQDTEVLLASKKQQHTQALLEDREFAGLARCQLEWETLAGKEEFFRQEALALALAEKAEEIFAPFSAWQESQRSLEAAQRELETREKQFANSRAALEKARENLNAHVLEQDAQESRKKQQLRLEGAREVYETLSQKEAAVDAGKISLERAKTTAAQAKRKFDQAEKSWIEALESQQKAMDDYRLAQEIYLRGIGGVLAEKLKAGEPCPVCGSREHPAPARRTTDHISEEELESRNQAMTRANEAVSLALANRTRAEQALSKAEGKVSGASQTLAVAVKDQENAQARKIPGIDTLAQLGQKMEALGESIEAYDRAGTQLQEALAEAQGDLKAAQGALTDAKTAADSAHKAREEKKHLWEAALGASKLETEEKFREAYLEPKQKQQRSEALVRHRTEIAQAKKALDAQQALLAGKTAPDLKTIEAQLKGMEREYKDLSSRLVLAQNRLETVTLQAQQLARRKQAHDEAREGVDRDLHFADRLMGSSGVSLQRYVLAVMMNSITVEAYHLLANVYGGRYRLYRTDAIAGSVHKGGLELEVYDSHNNQRRSVTTLSGGEKFLVALSLAIGLSTVVQAQGSGIRLEAMFIDEGFGSLDRESVRDALEVLQGIQRSAGVVGIISHVEALAESIPARIEITKGKDGSSCHIVT